MATSTPETKSPPKASLAPSFWYSNKNRILGVLVLLAGAAALVLFLRNVAESREQEAWAALQNQDRPGSVRTDVEIGDAVAGSSAEPWALLLISRNSFSQNKFDEAEQAALRLQNEFPEHALNDTPMVSELLADIRAEKTWRAQHEIRTENPEPDAEHLVTIQTELGEIQLGLYPNQAPAAVAEFLRLVRSGALATARFDEAVAGSYVLLTPQAPPADPENTSDDQETPPATDPSAEGPEAEASPVARGIVPDRNLLSHFQGAVSFFRAGPAIAADAQPRIAIYLQDMPAKDDQEVVFGQVQNGLQILEQIATRETVDETATLQEPLAVQGAEEAAGLQAIVTEGDAPR